MIYSIFFRSLYAFFLSFFLSFFLYKKIILWNNKKNFITENIRNLGIYGEKKKKGIPTMGGVIIIFSTLTSTIFFSSLKNIYIILLIITLLWIGSIGFIDDFIKIKYDKKGLSICGKILGQTIVGIFISSILYFNPITNTEVSKINFHSNHYGFKTTIPMIFSKCFNSKKEFNYSFLLKWSNKNLDKYTWIIFIPIITIIIVSLSNGSNLTDGIDGLVAGISIIILITLFLFSIFSSSKYYSSYFKIIYIPNIQEVIIFYLSIIGSLLSFLWYNTYPAKIFMGDTGSLVIGSLIAILAVINRIEFILPILGGIFLIENISVIIQILYLKYSKKKYGIGKRIFLMAPIHHHFQKLGYHENKICNYFILFQILLSILSLILFII